MRRSHTYGIGLDLRFRGFIDLWGVSRWELQASFWQGCLPFSASGGALLCNRAIVTAAI